MRFKEDIDYILSVRLMTYNHASYIEEALHGIDIQQTNFDFEIVVGDDFSTDNTLSIIKSFSFNNPNLHLKILDRSNGDSYHRERQKKGRLYNFVDTLHNCKGKYIALLDGDDFWTDAFKLQRQVDLLNKSYEFSGCFHNTWIVNENCNDSKRELWREYNKEVFYLDDLISIISLFHTSSFVFRKEALKIPNWFTKVQSGDMALFALIANEGRLFRLDELMSVYRKNSNGITSYIEIDEYHLNRIKLWSYFKELCPVQSVSRIEEVINYHSNQLKNNKKKVNKWYKLFAKLIEK